ncbi:MAG: hydantoinase/carbamoylase family amidase [Sandaracinaceae bacterium]|nr:hydantoinase/carbamoylase family amidase [Sandaracinaceae bacterium]
MSSTLSIDGDRLYRSLEALGRIGAYRDDDAGVDGVCRLAFSAADGEGRRHVVAAMKAAGLSVTVDGIGNVYARRAGREDALGPVMAGSHIDSVATAGRFDGCLGVLGALEVVRTLNDAGVITRRPLVVAFFSEEEGARFGTDMLGSAVATGRVPLERAYGLTDRDGAVVRDELEAIGFLGDAPVELPPPHAYVECHIEQGPTLRAAGVDVGVVTGVQAISWQELTIVGKSAHAGTTPMELRADPGVAASRVQLELRAMVRSGRFGDALRATMGVTVFEPGLVNVVPNRVRATVDLRHPDDAVLVRAEAELRRFLDRVALEERVTITARQTARTPDVAFAPAVIERVAAAATARGLTHQRIVSGAGHDCQEMARVCPAAMVFVPGERDGISHNPRELSTLEQCENGVNVLLDVLVGLAEEEGP